MMLDHETAAGEALISNLGGKESLVARSIANLYKSVKENLNHGKTFNPCSKLMTFLVFCPGTHLS